eukprot:20087-Heterococcus_DN1.PRE.6
MRCHQTLCRSLTRGQNGCAAAAAAAAAATAGVVVVVVLLKGRKEKLCVLCVRACCKSEPLALQCRQCVTAAADAAGCCCWLLLLLLNASLILRFVCAVVAAAASHYYYKEFVNGPHSSALCELSGRCVCVPLRGVLANEYGIGTHVFAAAAAAAVASENC